MCFFNHVLWVHKTFNVREIQVCQSKFMDIFRTELDFDGSVDPGQWNGKNVSIPSVRKKITVFGGGADLGSSGVWLTKATVVRRKFRMHYKLAPKSIPSPCLFNDSLTGSSRASVPCTLSWELLDDLISRRI